MKTKCDEYSKNNCLHLCSPTSPPRFAPFIFIARRLPPLASLVDSRPIVPAMVGALSRHNGTSRKAPAQQDIPTRTAGCACCSYTVDGPKLIVFSGRYTTINIPIP